jgi:osmotically inducible lipoprotein OsmB
LKVFNRLVSYRLKGATAIVAICVLSGCAVGGFNRQETGTAAGAVVGGIVGSAVTWGSTAGTVAGAAGGAVIGNQIGKQLDKK